MTRLLSRFDGLGAVFLAAACVAGAQPQEQPALPVLGGNQVVALLMQKNEERARAIEHYTSHRLYHLEYRGFPGAKEATMEVEARYDAPASKRFTVKNESGSKVILNRVFHRLLQSEQEAAEESNLKRNALTTANYNFQLVGVTGTNYILSVEPKQESKFLFRGRIWVDGHDFAVTKIEAEPAKNPSFWITKSEIHHTYEKVDDYFYLPKENTTVTVTRLGGVATLTIEYLSYSVTPSTKAASFPDEVVHHEAMSSDAILAGGNLGTE